jgi:hypothetical protein
MAGGKIDPGFIGVPYYGGSSFDPLEVMKTIQATQYRNRLSKQKEFDADMEKGLKDLSMEIKGWDDQQGSDEIRNELENLRASYVELGSKGMNLARPTSSQEQKLAKTFRTALGDLKQKHDVWQVEKQRVDEATKLIQDELKKPEEERTIDVPATKQAIEEWKTTKGGVIERSPKVNDLVVTKARPVDIGAFFADQVKTMIPGLDKHPERISVDLTTGKTTISMWEGVDPARAKEAVKKIAGNLKYAKPNIRNAVEKAYEADKGNTVLSKEEWIAQRFLPPYPERKDTRITGAKASDTGTDWSKVLPAKINGAYDTDQFKETKAFAIPTYDKTGKPSSGEKETFNSRATIPLQGVFKTVFTMPNAIHSIDTETGLQAPQARSAANMVDNVSFLPVAKKPLTVTIDGKQKTFNPGDKIPASVQRQLEKEDRVDEFVYEAFLTTLTSYKQVPKEAPEMFQGTPIEDLMGGIMSNANTTVTPWREAERYVKAAAIRSKVDLNPLSNFINDYLEELNGMESIFGEKTSESIYQSIYEEEPKKQ